MKQYDSDRHNPDNIVEREKKLKKPAKKLSKKLSIAAAAHWHSINIESLLGPINKKNI